MIPVHDRRPLTHREIAGCFNRRLGRSARVRLIGGGSEPLYLPDEQGWSVIRYTRDYPASALHEIAHWCIAGAGRRRQFDYGYWYRPPPRNRLEQEAFARVELPVQALESRLAAASGLSFQVSVDDVDGGLDFAREFSCQVAECAAVIAEAGLPPRAALMVAALERLRERL